MNTSTAASRTVTCHYMTDPKYIPIFVIPYLTLCAVLFHIAYWDTFNLNGLSYISVSDIIKSSIYPLLSISLFPLLGIFTSGYLSFDKTKIKVDVSNEETSLLKVLFIVVIFFAWLFCLHLLDYLPQKYKWLTWPILAGLPLYSVLYNSQFIKYYHADNKYKSAFVSLFIYLPFVFFASGKIESEKIQNNIEYKYSIRIHNHTIDNAIKVDTIKFLGITEKNIIFIDLKNESIFLIKSDKIDTLILKTKK